MRLTGLVVVASLPMLSGFAYGANKIVLGKLGQATDTTPIYAAPNSRARQYYKVAPYEYLVIRPAKSSAYFKVLLKNGVFGYVSKSAVAQLPYEVTAPAVNRSSVALSSRSAYDMARYSTNFIGTPYVWGGNDVQNGIDCSGFVKKMYGQIGINLPRTAAEQANVGTVINRLEELQPGDRLYFWDKKRNKIGHTGMYLGNSYFVHSSRGHNGVATDFLTTSWRKILVAARRGA